jgi:hypothetical protein
VRKTRAVVISDSRHRRRLSVMQATRDATLGQPRRGVRPDALMRRVFSRFTPSITHRSRAAVRARRRLVAGVAERAAPPCEPSVRPALRCRTYRTCARSAGALVHVAHQQRVLLEQTGAESGESCGSMRPDGVASPCARSSGKRRTLRELRAPHQAEGQRRGVCVDVCSTHL